MKSILILVFLFMKVIAFAQDAEKANPIQPRPYLTGNWGGARDSLKANGVNILPRLSIFYQGMVAGNGDKSFEFFGKADVRATLNGFKLGLKRFTLILHVEQNFGQTINNRAATLLPQNTAAAFPGIKGSDAFDITNLSLLYSFGKANTIMFGKINMVDAVESARFMGGVGLDGFQHIAFVAPPSGIVPPYMFGIIAGIKRPKWNYTFMLYDPASAANQTGFESPFKLGVTFLASVEKPVTINDKPGAHSVKVVVSTQDGTDLYNLGDLVFPIEGRDVNTKKSRYYLGYSFNQYLKMYGNSGKGWGLFGQTFITDGNPSTLDFGAIAGIGGNSFIKSRIDDNWGVGYFNYSVSNGIVKFAEPLLPLVNEQGLEIFYNAWLTK